jgi:hydrogenase maturation protease
LTVAEPARGQRVLVVGCGNPIRGDDRVGLVIARVLRLRLPPHVAVIAHCGDGTALLEMWQGARAVILIDAAHSDGDPGRVLRFDAAAGPLPVSLRAPSTHAFGAGEAIELARALGELPPTFLVYVITGKRYTSGAGLSPQVKVAARLVLAELAQAVRSVRAL